MSLSPTLDRVKRYATPKKRVLKEWPKAHAFQWSETWTIYNGDHAMGNVALGCGSSPAKAWDDAARNL